MIVESNKAIALVLVLVGFLICSEERCVIQPIWNWMQGIDVVVTRKSRWLLKQSVILVLASVTLTFKVTTWLVLIVLLPSLVCENK